MNKKIILVRHGETDWNVQLKLQGHQDIPLNQRGTEQALKVAKSLGGKEIDAIYSSDLQRAYQTATTIGIFHQAIEIKTLFGLREIHLGEWEGQTYQEIEKKSPEHLKKWTEDPSVQPPGGESILQFQTRVVNAFHSIFDQETEDQILVVAHGGTIKIFLATMLEIPIQFYWKLQIDQCRINVANYYDGEFILGCLNCEPK